VDGGRTCSACREAPARVHGWYCMPCQRSADNRNARNRREELRRLRVEVLELRRRLAEKGGGGEEASSSFG